MISKLNVIHAMERYFHKIAMTKVSPHSIAIGFAIGSFISILPTPGFNLFIGFLILLAYPKISKYSLFGSMALLNPLVVSPFYYLSIKIGNYVFGSAPIAKYDVVILNQIHQFSQNILFGTFIISLVFSIVSYFVVFSMIRRIHKKHDIVPEK